jgi:putative transposase
MREQPFLPRRHSVRLQEFDYSRSASYFLTICAQDMHLFFGRVIAGSVVLSALRQIVEDCWRQIPRHFARVELAPHIVMPNHIHGIVRLRPRVGDGSTVAKHPRRAQHAAPLRSGSAAAIENGGHAAIVPEDSIPAIVRSFKSAVAKRIREALCKPQFQVWQRSYYEHIIRDEGDFRNTCEYIRLNPVRWKNNKENW